MKRYSLLMFVLIATLALSSACLAGFPNYDCKTKCAFGDDKITVDLDHGWYDCQDAWFFCCGTSEQDTAVFVPKLKSALKYETARCMYVVTNYENCGPVFDAAPTKWGPANCYSGLWKVVYITWKKCARPWKITSTSGRPGCKPFLPTYDQADYSSSPYYCKWDCWTVKDCPIVAIGQLSNDWRCVPYGGYRIPQGLCCDSYRKKLTLPCWKVYCPKSKWDYTPCVKKMICTDVSDYNLAKCFGCNYAPQLGKMPYSDRQKMYAINWAQDCDARYGMQPAPMAYDQWAIAENYPDRNDCYNKNWDYCPVQSLKICDRKLYGSGAITWYKKFDSCYEVEREIGKCLYPICYPTPEYPREPAYKYDPYAMNAAIL